MARVLLVLPELPQRMGAPYMGQLYLAAALRRRGHEVRALDLAAPHERSECTEVAGRFAPDLVAMTLFATNALAGYRLAARLRGVARLLVAGGPHATACPCEAVERGFDASLAGEGEDAIVAIAELLDGPGRLDSVPGITLRAGVSGPPPLPPPDPDRLPFPHTALECFDPLAYHPSGEHVVPGGLLASRGCPARCTFCANQVTGRVHRARSAGSVVAEMRALRADHGVRCFSFWDDAFAAGRGRLRALCAAIGGEPALAGSTWTCITPIDTVEPADLRAMRDAGCVAVNFGVESGDPRILRLVRKGQRRGRVREALCAARDLGLTTIVNFMFGFPGEGPEELARTRSMMEDISPFTDFFNPRGVLVPFPGTPIYEEHHERYGFTEWWLDEARIEPRAGEGGQSTAGMVELLGRDPTLDLDFFRYSGAVRDLIAECVRFKASHNLAAMRRLGARIP